MTKACRTGCLVSALDFSGILRDALLTPLLKGITVAYNLPTIVEPGFYVFAIDQSNLVLLSGALHSRSDARRAEQRAPRITDEVNRGALVFDGNRMYPLIGDLQIVFPDMPSEAAMADMSEDEHTSWLNGIYGKLAEYGFSGMNYIHHACTGFTVVGEIHCKATMIGKELDFYFLYRR